MCQTTQRLTDHIGQPQEFGQAHRNYLFPVPWCTRVRRLNLFSIGLEDTIHGVDPGASLCVCQDDNFVTESCRNLFKSLSSCLTIDIFNLVPTLFCALSS